MMPVASADEIKSGKPSEVDLWCYFSKSNPDPDMFAAQMAPVARQNSRGVEAECDIRVRSL